MKLFYQKFIVDLIDCLPQACRFVKFMQCVVLLW